MSGHPFWRNEVAARLQELQQELSQMLARSPREAAPPGAEPPDAPTDLEPTHWEPPVDLVEDAQEVRVWVDLPGVDSASIDLSISGNVLTLRGQRPPIEAAATGRQHALERPVGPFRRQVALPCEVDVEKVEAHARDGVLIVRLPKAAAHRPRVIPIHPS